MAGNGVKRVLVVQRGDGVVLATLNRPEALNALDAALLEALGAAFRSLGEGTRAVVLTGARRAFCTGADLKARAGMDVAQWRAHHETLRDAFAAVRECPYPTIAAVEGFALAGGLELALACDLVVAGDEAQLGLPEVTRGIMPGAGGTVALPALVGAARAKELIFTGRRLDAATAAEWGLVARVAPAGAAAEAALELAREIAANAPLAVRAAKRAIDGENELEAYWSCIPSEDQREGIRAFVERREARFEGR
jgi:enoyl-CoA hydratase/carnithine racemase